MASNSKNADQAEAKKAQKARDGQQAVADYEAEGRAVRAKTVRLRELRLAKEAADKAAEAEKQPVRPAKKSRPPAG